MTAVIEFINVLNGILWHDFVLYGILGVGILFTIWSFFCQYRALTHGVAVVQGKYDNPDDPGAISHFQALSAALSATVGLGNIAGVAIAIALGGPGAVFWMWMVGLAGMALKTIEVALSMLYRDTSDPENPKGGPMYVAKLGFAELGWAKLGSFVGGIFCITLLISAVTGGNMFQAWNVADITYSYFQVPKLVTGIVLAVMVGLVIIGGIKRIGGVAGKLVPMMCGLYVLAALYVVFAKFSLVPEVFKMIVQSAFSPAEAQGAFLGGTFGYAFLWGMKRALFSNEAGQGSAPIAHAAAKTDEPIREAVVGGLGPFIDTIVICTLTALVILCSGVWNRSPDAVFKTAFKVVPVAAQKGAAKATPSWTLAATNLPAKTKLLVNTNVFTVLSAGQNVQAGNKLHRIYGVVKAKKGGQLYIAWKSIQSAVRPKLAVGIKGFVAGGVYTDYKGATMTARAFDNVSSGLGMWLVTIASWLFAFSTMISWSYYGEQGMVYIAGEKSVLPYKLVYCLLIVVAAMPQLVSTTDELDALTGLGTGVMLFANIPIMLIFGKKAIDAYHSYMKRLDNGEFKVHK